MCLHSGTCVINPLPLSYFFFFAANSVQQQWMAAFRPCQAMIWCVVLNPLFPYFCIKIYLFLLILPISQLHIKCMMSYVYDVYSMKYYKIQGLVLLPFSALMLLVFALGRASGLLHIER